MVDWGTIAVWSVLIVTGLAAFMLLLAGIGYIIWYFFGDIIEASIKRGEKRKKMWAKIEAMEDE